MKLLMIFCEKFGYKTSMKTLEDIPDLAEDNDFDRALVGFIQVEAEDEENSGPVETKLVKNLKWAARKNDTKLVILHSFAHLSDSKASPEFTKSLFDNAETRLSEAGYQVAQTPFGYFLDLRLKAPGYPLSWLFKEF
jgi:hypothetical protein